MVSDFYQGALWVLAKEIILFTYTSREKWPAEMKTLHSNKLRSFDKGKELIGNSVNDNASIASLRETFCEHYETLSHELRIRQEGASYSYNRDNISFDRNNKFEEDEDF